MCVNYRTFNALIIKNRNCLLFIRKIFVKLCATKYYIKFNVITTFNEISIRENNEKKNVFNQIRIVQIHYYVIRFLQCVQNVSILHQRSFVRIFKRFLHNLFKQHFNLQQQQKKTHNSRTQIF